MFSGCWLGHWTLPLHIRHILCKIAESGRQRLLGPSLAFVARLALCIRLFPLHTSSGVFGGGC